MALIDREELVPLFVDYVTSRAVPGCSHAEVARFCRQAKLGAGLKIFQTVSLQFERRAQPLHLPVDIVDYW